MANITFCDDIIFMPLMLQHSSLASHAGRSQFYVTITARKKKEHSTLHHDPLLLEQVDQGGTFAAAFVLGLLLDPWQGNPLRPGLALIVWTHLEVLGHGRELLEAPLVHRREQCAEPPHLKSESGIFKKKLPKIALWLAF